MKVIKPGFIPCAPTRKVICPQCGAELEYEDRDVRTTNDPANDGQKSVASIECGYCRGRIVLNAAKGIVPPLPWSRCWEKGRIREQLDE